jgi:hypothetical protein
MTFTLKDVFKFFKNLMEALGGARPNRAEDLEWLRELDRRLGEILERRAGGKLGPRAIGLPRLQHPHKRRKLGTSAIYSRQA